VLLLPHSSQDNQRPLPLGELEEIRAAHSSWNKQRPLPLGELEEIRAALVRNTTPTAQKEHRTRINAQVKIDQQHKRKTRKELTFRRTHRNNKLNRGNTLCKRTPELKPGLPQNPACTEEKSWCRN
jgi:hypothetical protein